MKTNFQMVKELNKKYDEMDHTNGIVTMKEIYLINEVLCLDEMDELQLRNLRDFIVLFFSRETNEDRFEKMDKVSAFTCVIDNKLVNKGCEV